jgi:TolB-like protein/DNA-binding winged helix-turn-helix (wHTH) protein/tetratricopeptide (TPR) repeat protein
MKDCIYRFAEFELIAAEGELRKHNSSVRLQEKPLLLLTALLDNPQELVTREQLRRHMWDSQTFVDYEQGINVAIKKIRDSLGDSAEQPTFIQTVAKKGYRFLLPVDVTEREQNVRISAPQAIAADPQSQSGATHPLHRSFIAGASAVLVFVAFVLWVALAHTTRPHPVSEIHSLAVLPLRDLSPVPSQEYFADGITEELITSLAQSLPLRVISRTSVMRYKETSEPIRQIARELGVEAIVEGAVVRSGNRVRVTLQLIDAIEDRHLWAQSYERDFGDFLGMEAELSREMTTQIGRNLSLRQQSRTTKTRTADPKVYEMYLKGRYFWNKRTDEGMEKAAAYFRQAIDSDPGYAPAYVGLADCYLFGQPPTLPPKALAIKAKEMASKALELDDSLGEAHATLALIAENLEWDWSGAEREYKRAIELNPNYATAHQWYGEYLALPGRFDESIEQMRIARELDPLSLVIIKDSGEAYYSARKYDKAVEFFRKTLDMDSGFSPAHRYLAMTYLQQGKSSDAVAELQMAAHQDDSPDILAELGYAYALAGARREAQKVLHDLQLMSERRYTPARDYALIYTGLGDKDRGFEWLEKAYREHAVLGELGVDPRWDSLRADPRFTSLMKRMGLPIGKRQN